MKRLFVAIAFICFFLSIFPQNSGYAISREFDTACKSTGRDPFELKGELEELNKEVNGQDYSKALVTGGTLLNYFDRYPEMQRFRQYFDVLSRYGVALYLTGNHHKAIDILKQAEKEWAQKGEVNSPQHVVLILYIAETYAHLGENFTARYYLDKAEKMGIDASVRNRYLMAKGSLLEKEGEDEEALKIFKQIENPSESISLHIDKLRYLVGDRENVVAEMLEKYGDIKNVTPNNLRRLTFLTGILSRNDSTLDKSIELGQKLIDYHVLRNLETRDSYMMTLYDQGKRLKQAGRLEEAQKVLYKAWKAMDDWHKNDTGNRILILDEYADVCYLIGDYEKASVHAYNNFILNNNLLAINMLRPEGRRENYWNKRGKFFVSVFPKINISYPYPLAVQNCYNSLLAGKSMMNYSNKVFGELADKIGGEAKKNYDEYAEYNSRAKTETDPERYADLKLKGNEAFKRFSNICYSNQEFRKRFSFDWESVAESLQLGESAVEFFEYEDAAGKVQYGACVIPDSKSRPFMKYLFDGEILEGIDRKTPDRKMWETVWEPLEEYLSKSTKVYFSAAGQLHILPVEYSQGDKPVEYIRLTSTRNLIDRNRKEVTPEEMVLYGGLTYRMTPANMKMENQKYPKRRDLDLKYFRQGAEKNIEPLENTLYEVEEIAEIVSPRLGRHPKILKGREGVEESFKALSGNSPEILHVATHGFFFDNNSEEELPLTLDSGIENTGRDQAMMRSGLLLSGANKAFSEGILPEDTDDGILTALEISELDLGNTELAVLSACETGLGSISGDGVAGLQSAFKQAGVEQLLISLWKVDDKATSELMKEFYRQWIIEGKTKREALIIAQDSIRNDQTHPEWQSPDFWAAFILLDGLN